MSTTPYPSDQVKWYFSQMKGTTQQNSNEADIITSLEFDETGDFLSTGDKGGRIVVFKRNPRVLSGYTWSRKSESYVYRTRTAEDRPRSGRGALQHDDDEEEDENAGRAPAPPSMTTDSGDTITPPPPVDYQVYCTFTSHEAEFDCLKSLEIEEKINKIRWIPQMIGSRCLLTTNDKTVKLYQLCSRHRLPPGHNFVTKRRPASHITDGMSLTDIIARQELDENDDPNAGPFPFHHPQAYPHQRYPIDHRMKRKFAEAHTYNINDLSVSPDLETFISSDDLRINLWHLQENASSFQIVDMKPASMEDLTEVITCAQFHPSNAAHFVFASSKGLLRLCDTRKRALCDTGAIVLHPPDNQQGHHFFSDVINSISDARFSHCGRMIAARDYLDVKVWDLRMAGRRQPLEVFHVHEHVRKQLCLLYEKDRLFDKFELSWSPCDRFIMTGSYDNRLRVFRRPNQSAAPEQPGGGGGEATGAAGDAIGCSDSAATAVDLEEQMRGSGSDAENERVAVSCASEINLKVSTKISQPMARSGSDPLPNHVNPESLPANRINERLLHITWHPRQLACAIATTSNLFLLSGTPPPPHSSSAATLED